MIVGQRKPLAEIGKMISDYERVLILGCGTCVSVCLAGGDKEVATLASALRIADRAAGKVRSFTEDTVKRQCEWEYLDQVADRVTAADVVVSLACGIGVQALAEHFPTTPILPGLNTSFLGMPQELGVFSERCAACGDCILYLTAGICPIARCAKSLLNGPCGGSQNGRCEVSADTPCAWQLIIDRLTALGQLEKLEEIVPPKDWSTSFAGGPRRIVIAELVKSGG